MFSLRRASLKPACTNYTVAEHHLVMLAYGSPVPATVLLPEFAVHQWR